MGNSPEDIQDLQYVYKYNEKKSDGSDYSANAHGFNMSACCPHGRFFGDWDIPKGYIANEVFSAALGLDGSDVVQQIGNAAPYKDLFIASAVMLVVIMSVFGAHYWKTKGAK